MGRDPTLDVQKLSHTSPVEWVVPKGCLPGLPENVCLQCLPPVLGLKNGMTISPWMKINPLQIEKGEGSLKID